MTRHGPKLRPAAPPDIAAIRQLMSDAGLPQEGIEDHFGEAYVVADSGGVVVGCAGIEVYGVDGLLRSVAVTNECRSRGLGRELVLNRLDWARNRELETIYLLTETAAGYFEGLGFRHEPRDAAPPGIASSHEFAVCCPDGANFMKISIGGGR